MQGRHRTLLLEHKIDVALGRAFFVALALARPFHLDRAELPEGLLHASLCEVPRHSPQKDLGRVDRWSPSSSRWWQLSRPGAGDLAHRGGVAVLLCCSFQGKRVGRGVEGSRKRSSSGEGRKEVLSWAIGSAELLLMHIGLWLTWETEQSLQQVWPLGHQWLGEERIRAPDSLSDCRISLGNRWKLMLENRAAITTFVPLPTPTLQLHRPHQLSKALVRRGGHVEAGAVAGVRLGRAFSARGGGLDMGSKSRSGVT